MSTRPTAEALDAAHRSRGDTSEHDADRREADKGGDGAEVGCDLQRETRRPEVPEPQAQRLSPFCEANPTLVTCCSLFLSNPLSVGYIRVAWVGYSEKGWALRRSPLANSRERPHTVMDRLSERLMSRKDLSEMERRLEAISAKGNPVEGGDVGRFDSK
jgi:hypothetical protein